MFHCSQYELQAMKGRVMMWDPGYTIGLDFDCWVQTDTLRYELVPYSAFPHELVPYSAFPHELFSLESILSPVGFHLAGDILLPFTLLPSTLHPSL